MAGGWGGGGWDGGIDFKFGYSVLQGLQDVLMSSFKYSALADETPPLQSPVCWLNNLCFIGWSCSLLKLAAWVSSLQSLRSSSD